MIDTICNRKNRVPFGRYPRYGLSILNLQAYQEVLFNSLRRDSISF